MIPKKHYYSFDVYLGKEKNSGHKIYLTGFKWDCSWYWDGGYLKYNFKNGKQATHTHFNIVFIDKQGNHSYAIWKDLKDIVDDAQFDGNDWWRIKDLYKQFYILKNAAEVFQYGGYCTSKNGSKEELNQDMVDKINTHIENVIIPEIIKILKINNKE